jgi:hypothetical protein
MIVSKSLGAEYRSVFACLGCSLYLVALSWECWELWFSICGPDIRSGIIWDMARSTGLGGTLTEIFLTESERLKVEPSKLCWTIALENILPVQRKITNSVFIHFQLRPDLDGLLNCFLFWWDWGLDSGLYTHKAGALQAIKTKVETSQGFIVFWKQTSFLDSKLKSEHTFSTCKETPIKAALDSATPSVHFIVVTLEMELH